MKTNLENYEERFVDYMEGQLNAEEMREVEAFVAQHPELEEDFKLFCSSKLEPDTNVVFTKKEQLMQPTTVIRPLFVKILVAAACVALFIGLGVRFLKPHQELVQQSMLANLSPIKLQKIEFPQDLLELRKSNTKATSIPKPAPESERPDHTFEMLTMDPILYQQVYCSTKNDNVERRMFLELNDRLIAATFYDDTNPSVEEPLATQKDQAVAAIQESFIGNIRQNAKTLYKQTAKTVMNVYHTADYCINEVKSNIDVRRELVSLP